MGDVTAVAAAAGAEAWREGLGNLTVRLCRLQEARLASGAVLLLPEGVMPGAGEVYCGWPVIRVPVPEPMIGLPGGEPQWASR
jgi:hypothetical protein